LINSGVDGYFTLNNVEAVMNISKKLTVLGLCFLLIVSLGCQKNVKKVKVKAGAYYFDGWTARTERLKTEFSEREPIWGWEEGTQEIMDQQIDLAADAGLDFWAIDWYYPETDTWRGKSGYTYQNHPLNDALGLYLKSEKKDRLEFCLLVANHPPYRILAKDWDKVCDIWIGLFKEKNYLTVDNQPLLIYFHPHQLIETFENPQGLQKAFDQLAQKAISAGFDGVFNAACTYSFDIPEDYAAAGYDGYTGYNYRGVSGSSLRLPRGGDSTFAALAGKHEEIWDYFAEHSDLPYIPQATLGWDNRPRNPEKKMNSPYFWFTQPTPNEIENHIHNAINWLDENPTKTLKDRLLLIYSWNEVAEGAYLTPTKVAGDAHLQALSRALGR
jgi:hypothetical protein